MIMGVGCAEILHMGALGRQQLQLWSIADAVQRPVQPRRHARADPDHQIGLLQTRRLRGAHLKRMAVGPFVQQKFGLTQIAHHLRHQRMHSGNVGDHAGHFGHGGQGGAGQK